MSETHHVKINLKGAIMIELPESNTLAKQIVENLVGKTVTSVIAAQSPHKFAWYHGDPDEYPARLMDNTIIGATAYGMFVEINLSGSTLLFSDGVNLRLHPAAGPVPQKHQLLLGFTDSTFLSATVAMYGGIQGWKKGEVFENSYYESACAKPSPLTEAFDETYFQQLMAPGEVQKLSLKAALATEQRIPGLGNGTLHDILWKAKLNPKRKVNTLSTDEIHTLYVTLKQILLEMTKLGGRSTEKDLFGNLGGYQVVMCSENNGKACPNCGTVILKEAYLGGSVYTCKTCQPV